MAGLGFWDDQDSAQRAIAESNTIKSWTEPWAAADSDVADLADLLEMLKESPVSYTHLTLPTTPYV